MTARAIKILDVPIADPSYAGHFPDQPLLPGSALLALILSLLPGPCRRLDRVKLVSPTRPGERLTVELLPGRRPGLIRFACYRQDETLVCSGLAQVTPGIPADAPST
jgi:3-hydroxyacyl-[acyl-carrier-protein] dehydratase